MLRKTNQRFNLASFSQLHVCLILSLTPIGLKPVSAVIWTRKIRRIQSIADSSFIRSVQYSFDLFSEISIAWRWLIDVPPTACVCAGINNLRRSLNWYGIKNCIMFVSLQPSVQTPGKSTEDEDRNLGIRGIYQYKNLDQCRFASLVKGNRRRSQG